MSLLFDMPEKSSHHAVFYGWRWSKEGAEHLMRAAENQLIPYHFVHSVQQLNERAYKKIRGRGI
jgi:hypothetical protein